MAGGASGVYHVGGSEVLGRAAFAEKALAALSGASGLGALDPKLVVLVATSNAGQVALRPLASGLKLEKLLVALPGWKPRTVDEALKHWVENPFGKPLGQ